MSKITDYGFLFQQMFGTKGTKSTSAIGSFQLSQLNSGSVQAQLRAAGIDTNSAQYKAAISGALDGITRESVEANLKKSGSSLTQASVDTRI